MNSDKKCDHSGLIGRPSQTCQDARIQMRPSCFVTRTVPAFLFLPSPRIVQNCRDYAM